MVLFGLGLPSKLEPVPPLLGTRISSTRSDWRHKLPSTGYWGVTLSMLRKDCRDLTRCHQTKQNLNNTFVVTANRLIYLLCSYEVPSSTNVSSFKYSSSVTKTRYVVVREIDASASHLGHVVNLLGVLDHVSGLGLQSLGA